LKIFCKIGPCAISGLLESVGALTLYFGLANHRTDWTFWLITFESCHLGNFPIVFPFTTF